MVKSKNSQDTIATDNFRRQRAEQACQSQDHPSHKLKVFGVTGTNGKTTSTYLIESLLAAAGEKPAVIGTIENRFQNQRVPSTLTTPGSVELQSLLAHFLKEGATAVVMEVSSHGLHQFRPWKTKFKAVLFTNLTQDHLDYHGTMEEYFQAKRRLFFDYESDLRVINADNPWGARLATECRQAGLRTITYGHQNQNVTFENIKLSAQGISGSFDAHFEGRSFSIEVASSLLGDFNVQNLAQTAALGVGLGLSPPEISNGLNNCWGVPGRMESVPNTKNLSILVDYAHTPDALEKALHTLRPLCGGALKIVFGCGGDRDATKRPQMGSIAEQLADQIFITSDNPRTEAPDKIIDQILSGIKDSNKCTVEPDRRKSIGIAIKSLRPKDILLIAGKGHEDYQIIGTEKHHFDDREIATAFLLEPSPH